MHLRYCYLNISSNSSERISHTSLSHMCLVKTKFFRIKRIRCIRFPPFMIKEMHRKNMNGDGIVTKMQTICAIFQCVTQITDKHFRNYFKLHEWGSLQNWYFIFIFVIMNSNKVFFWSCSNTDRKIWKNTHLLLW